MLQLLLFILLLLSVSVEHCRCFFFTASSSSSTFPRRPPTTTIHNRIVRKQGSPRNSNSNSNFLLPHPPPSTSTTRTTRTTQLFAAASPSSSSNDETKNSVLKEGRLVELISGGGSGGKGGSGNKNKNKNKKGGGLVLGVIIGKDGKRNFKILNSSGRIVSIPPRSIKHCIPNGYSSTSSVDDIIHHIQQHEITATRALQNDILTKGLNVIELWELLLDEEEENDEDNASIDLSTLSELLLGNSTSLSCYATRIVLTEGVERFCFKEISSSSSSSSGPMYEPRPVDIVETLRKQAEMEAREVLKWEELKQRINDNTINIESETEEIQLGFQSLERFACLTNLSPEEVQKEGSGAGEDVDAIALAKQFLHHLDRRAIPEVAKQLLVSIGIWNKHTNLDLIRMKIPIIFDPYLEDVIANDLIVNPPLDLDHDKRVNLTHLVAFAIDDSSTKEIDDAISVEQIISTPTTSTDDDDSSSSSSTSSKRLRLWIHISDPTRYIQLGSVLELEARKRKTSIYLPTGTISMFPMKLASGILSLNPGTISHALSVGIVLDETGGIDPTISPIITPSLIQTTKLTYDEVDILLDPFCMVDTNKNNENNGMDSDSSILCDMNIETVVESLRQLQFLSEERLRWRIDGGSLESISSYELPDMKVTATPSSSGDDGWDVDVYAKKRNIAHQIVTECALVANEAIAFYGMKHGIPMPFRSQEMVQLSDTEITMTPEGPCRSWLAITSTTRSQISTNPLPHAGLGLDVYVQATSPVRRYADLAVHYQIKSHLRGETTLPFPIVGTRTNDDSSDDDDSSSSISSSSSSGDTISTMISIAQTAGLVSRQLERPANDYWLKEFLRRRGTEPTQVLVLYQWKDNIYKLFLPEFGAIFNYKSTTTNISVGQQMDMQSLHLSELL